MMRTWCVGRWLASNASSVRAFSALPAQQIADSVSAYRPVKFRASENDTAKQSESDLGMFYRLPDSDVQRLFSVYSQWRPKYVELAKAFCESCLMVRKPALEVIQYLKNFDASRPCLRYVLYGRHGAGKSMSLSHVMHYGATHDWVIVNAHFPSHWFKDDLEMNPSATVEGRFDLPFAGAKFLAHTKAQNAAMFATLTTTREYEWTKRETTPAGAPLSQLIEQGIQRVKFSNDVVLALLSELKAHANAGNCKLLVVIGGVNALFMTSNYATPDRKSTYAVKDFTLAQALYPLLSSDWKGGAVVSSVTTDATRRDNRYSFYPRHLLGEEGFEALDPFVPVRVENYSSKELESCLDYYIDRLWVQNPAAKTPEGRKELAFLSANNPMILQEICGSL